MYMYMNIHVHVFTCAVNVLHLSGPVISLCPEGPASELAPDGDETQATAVPVVSCQQHRLLKQHPELTHTHTYTYTHSDTHQR